MIKLKILCAYLMLSICDPQAFADVIESYSANETTLAYVTAVFRHGERTVDASTVYPHDPYINETYFPYGIGQLTAKGKEREFNLGQILRKRYDPFLGSLYTPEILEAISTNMNRTKASLALVLAGLYPPQGNQMEWSSKLNWQPIPYNYLDYEKDLWFSVAIYFCPNYIKEYAKYLETPEGKNLQEKYQSLYDYLSEHTGKNIRKVMDLFFIHSCLQSQLEWGLKLPEWTESVFPDVLTEGTKDGLASGVATKKLIQLSGGLLIKHIVENMKAKANNTLEPELRKLSLYSGHDLGVVYLLSAMQVFEPHVVPYGACVLVELHKISDTYYVKIVYIDYSTDEPKTLTVPGCESLCPLSKFEELVKVYYPEKDDPCGDDTKVLDEHSEMRDYYNGKLRHKSVVRRYFQLVRETRGKLKKTVFSRDRDFFNKTRPAALEKARELFGKRGDHAFPKLPAH